ncbi:MAG: hypothetical protein PHN98_12160 [Smithellaceae bacterium]|nr:hypothetical protein [Smithellaceae bacterium]
MTIVGENIDAYCLKCKLILSHVILFKVDGVAHRVKCKTCGAEHKYRGTMPPIKKTAAVRKPGAVRAKKPVAEKVTVNTAPLLWNLKIHNMGPSKAMRNYSIKETYKVNDVINHPVFGIGFVEETFWDKSISVLFNDSVKLMGMNIN